MDTPTEKRSTEKGICIPRIMAQGIAIYNNIELICFWPSFVINPFLPMIYPNITIINNFNTSTNTSKKLTYFPSFFSLKYFLYKWWWFQNLFYFKLCYPTSKASSCLKFSQNALFPSITYSSVVINRLLLYRGYNVYSNNNIKYCITYKL